jgi:hypothetical protein
LTTPIAGANRGVDMGALTVHVPPDCGSSRMPAAPARGPAVGVEVPEHPESALINAKAIIVAAENRLDIKWLPTDRCLDIKLLLAPTAD